MLESILAEIDSEIARLQAAKALLSSASGTVASRKSGKPTGSAAATPVKAVKRRTMSAEARERIRQAQIKRWATAKKAARPNTNAAVSPIPAARKKAAKAAA